MAGYKVYRDGQIVGTPAAPSFSDTAYSYAVSGYDAANNESFLSPSLDVITDPAPPPTNVAPVVTISAPADGSSFTEGDSVIFMAAASDTEDGDIDGGKEKNKNRWRANANFAIHDTNHSPVSGAIVSHSWSSRDASGSGVCTTDGAGRCPSDWTPYLRKGNKSVAFTVDSVASSLQYQSADNHDPDGDSDGIAITIVKP